VDLRVRRRASEARLSAASRTCVPVSNFGAPPKRAACPATDGPRPAARAQGRREEEEEEEEGGGGGREGRGLPRRSRKQHVGRSRKAPRLRGAKELQSLGCAVGRARKHVRQARSAGAAPPRAAAARRRAEAARVRSMAS
ncbi:unnamed protein product, partial [Prorocentrum cordatum]